MSPAFQEQKSATLNPQSNIQKDINAAQDKTSLEDIDKSM